MIVTMTIVVMLRPKPSSISAGRTKMMPPAMDSPIAASDCDHVRFQDVVPLEEPPQKADGEDRAGYARGDRHTDLEAEIGVRRGEQECEEDAHDDGIPRDLGHHLGRRDIGHVVVSAAAAVGILG